MIKYVRGDLFDHVTDNDCIIHVVNNRNVIGGGFTKPLIKRYFLVKLLYHTWFITSNEKSALYVEHPQVSVAMTGKAELGETQTINFHHHVPKCTVVNMMAQDGLINHTNPHPLKMDALLHCLRKVVEADELKHHRIVAPKFGAGLAGGDWLEIESLINSVFQNREITIYKL